MYETILYDVQDPVARITLNRPERLNASTTRMMAEIEDALAQAERSAEVVGIVLTGAGRGFCAGADMAGLQAIEREGDISAQGPAGFEPERPGDPGMGTEFERGLARMLAVRKPVIAAVNGPCAGWGMSLAMFCDLRFASERAVFTTAFAHRGLVAEHGMSWVLPRLIGASRALDILWSGRRFDAEEALQLGVVNRVFPADQLLDETEGYVRELASTCCPTSLMHMKRQIYRDLMLPLDEAMRDTEARMAASVKRPDYKEGLASFVEKRAPQFERVAGS